MAGRQRKKICPQCKERSKPRNCRYCRPCKNAYMIEWRKTHPLSPEQKFKAIVRRKTLMRIQRGLLVRYPCEVCGIKKVQAHHDDYNKPYDVRWLCKKHHLAHHKAIREVRDDARNCT